MAKIEKFENILAWQKAQRISISIYKEFKSNKDFGFKDQIFRAAVSISNNIAEGFERQSNKELRKFLYIAKGSCGEVRSMLHLANSLGYLKKEDYEKLVEETTEVSKMLSGFIKTL